MMQKYRLQILITIILAIIFFSCEKKVKYDPPVLDEETMVEVLKVIYVTEVKTVDTYELTIQKSKYLKEYIYPELFDSLKINPKDFYQSYRFYDQQPEALTQLLDKVVAAVDQLEVDTIKVFDGGKSLEQVYDEIHQIETIKENKKQTKRKRNE